MDFLRKRPDINKMVVEVAREQKLKNCKICSVKTKEKGEGFAGQIFMITLFDPSSTKTLDVVIKAAFTDEKMRSMGVSTEKAYQNECYFYTTVYPAFKKLEKSKEVTEQNELVPKCYKVCLDNKQEKLCLENLVTDGFETFDKLKILDDDHVELIYKNYGRLHAYSFALRDQQPEEYDQISKGFSNILNEEFGSRKGGFFEVTRQFAELAKKYLIPGEDDEVIRKFEKYTTDEINDIFRNVITEVDDYCAITHGDCWSNNMMFKYKNHENGKKVCDMRLLDLQLAKVGSPICDLAYCLYTGGDKVIFDNLDKYLRIYHESFSSFLKKLGSDPEKLFPFDKLTEHWKKYSRFGMLLGMSVLKVKFTLKEEAKDFSDNFDEPADAIQAIIQSKFDEKVYQKRIRELLHHMLKLNTL